MATDPIVHMWLRNIWIMLVAILLILVLNSFASAQTVVYTNVGPHVVSVVRTYRPAASVPVSIQRRANELQSLGLLPEMWFRARMDSNLPMAVPSVLAPVRATPAPSYRATPVAPLFIDGLYVGPSPNGQWTSISHITPTINIRMIK